ncbi:MAG: hypothetical protein ACYDDA_04945 [Acidiferrobacteraceae bacterium]
MNNGSGHLESFEDVENEFRAVRVERANDVGAIMQAIGRLAAEVSGLRKADDELRRVLIEGGFPHRTDDTGSHDLRETYAQLKALASDPSSPFGPNDLRTAVERVTEEMRLRAEVGTWRKIKAFPSWAARKAAAKALEWAVIAALAAGAAELWRLLHH